MKIYSIKPKFQKVLNPVKDIFIKLKINPSTINDLALVTSLIAGIILFYSDKNLELLILIPILAFIRTAFNALDGMVARETKAKNQRFGEVLNESIDRFSDVFFFLGLALTSYINTPLAFGTLISILLVSYMGIVGKAAGGSRQYGGLMGKADRMFWLSIGSVLTVIFKNTEIMNWTLSFILIFCIITMMMRISAIKKELIEPEKYKKIIRKRKF